MQPPDKAETADQSAVFAFLGDAATYGLSAPIKRIDTHGAVVFLAGDDVYKVKRAVHFSYMDFSTLEKRKAACEAEIAVNRDNAPALYLETVPITRAAHGLHLGGDGEPVEWAVHLRRFNEEATLDRLAEQGPFESTLLARLAAAVSAAHRQAPIRDGEAATAALRRALVATVDELCDRTDVFASEDDSGAFRARLITAFDQGEPLLLRRGGKGKVRRCHGDLHLRNIVLIDGAPVLFDAIEFNEALAVTDILYDLAFLIMDLWHRGLAADANLLLNRYLWASDDAQSEIEGLALLPLFLALRAAIRAIVMAAQSRLDPAKTGLRDNARSYLEAAGRFLDPVAPCLVAVGGLSGTGKSVLCAALAPSIGAAPGALHLRSDIERKNMFGGDEMERLPAEAYRSEISAQVYERLKQLAETGLKAGRGVILDATYTKPEGRKVLADLAAAAGLCFTGIWLEAPLDLLTKRVNERRGDASDATADVVAGQAQEDLGDITWHRLDASKSTEVLKAEALALIGSA
ncbi:AAA family ATPase [Methyloferula stellata]|uniref:bifunctional aminoglycoside phosphotransferase/ATP-binding protein n=1 Tax=Methyloferula stellata TaxID=876270 RepID=UPI00036FA391|nr:bifunctional aminoglycoside phosphotransferase/ATP-binding protein [Methyloferula stellata]